jgi:hypothetical protein
MKKPKTLDKRLNSETFRLVAAIRKVFFFCKARSEAKRKAAVKNQYKCAHCAKLFDKVFVDHIKPVIDPKIGFVDWNTYIFRLFCPSNELQILCKPCHGIKTKEENKIRREFQSSSFNKRPIIGTNLQTGELKYFDSVLAASKELNIEHSCISRICGNPGERKQTGGWWFEYQGPKVGSFWLGHPSDYLRMYEQRRKK